METIRASYARMVLRFALPSNANTAILMGLASGHDPEIAHGSLPVSV